MFITYGNYASASGECTLAITTQVTRDEDETASEVVVSWVITGVLLGDSPQELTTKIQALEAAFAIDNQDARWYQNDGVTQAANSLISGQSVNGVKSSRVQFPNGEGTEYVNHRSYQVTLTAKYAPGGPPNIVVPGTLDFQEQVTQTGNGRPRYVIREPRNGPPIKQLVSEQTPVVVTQSGTATNKILGGVPNYPFPNPTIFPIDYLRNPETSITRTINGRQECVTSWNYIFDIPGDPGGAYPIARN